MAKTQADQQALAQAAARYTGVAYNPNAYDQAFNDSSISTADRIREVINSPEAQAYAQRQAEEQYGSQINSIDQTAASTKSDLDTLIRQLEQQKQEAPEQTFGDFNRRGLFRSSMAQTAVANQLGDFTNKIGNAQIQRSTRLADLAMQRAMLINKRTQYGNDILYNYRSSFDEQQAKIEAEQEAERQRRASAARQQQQQQNLLAAMTRQNQQAAQPQTQNNYGDEDLDSMDGVYTSGNAYNQLFAPSVGPTTYSNAFGNPASSLVSQLGKNFGSVQTPSFLGGFGQKVFGKNLFGRG